MHYTKVKKKIFQTKASADKHIFVNGRTLKNCYSHLHTSKTGLLIANDENYHGINCRPILLQTLSRGKNLKISNKKARKMGMSERDSMCIKE